eukprot:5568055-Amphidinium_carterae.1
MKFNHGLHYLEPSLRKCSLEAVYADREDPDCVHCSDAALWNRALKTIRVNHESVHSPHYLEPAPRERSLEAVYGDLE